VDASWKIGVANFILKLLGVEDEVIYQVGAGMKNITSARTPLQAPALLAKMRKQTDEN
jgi:hypothetical protein